MTARRLVGAADGLRRALKMSILGASAIEGDSMFHSGIVLGKKDCLPVRLRVSTYSAVFITVGSTGAGVCTDEEYLPLAQPADRIQPYKESEA